MCEKFTLEELSNTEKKKIILDNIEIEAYEYFIASANDMSVCVGTTGFCGGDTGHGARTYLKIEDHTSTDLMVRFKESDSNHDKTGFKKAQTLELRFGGDCELRSFIDTLEFAAKVLKTQARNSKSI
ncbi:MAG: hypothetical protein KAT71_01315 [Gammaproteobacteria bacterium]|nr:hypothetical protein [Gammaproteobacteria bacterium]